MFSNSVLKLALEIDFIDYIVTDHWTVKPRQYLHRTQFLFFLIYYECSHLANVVIIFLEADLVFGFIFESNPRIRLKVVSLLFNEMTVLLEILVFLEIHYPYHLS